MQVDNPLNFNFPSHPAFEDFFNMDLLAGPSSGAASSSRSSSSSPSNTFSPLPPTPPNEFMAHEPSTNPFFNFLDDDFNTTKIDPLAPPPATSAPFDFLGAFPSAAELQSSSPGAGAGAATSPSVGDSPVGIDPQLVGTPATAKDMSEFGEEEDHSPSLEDDLEDMEDDSVDSPSPSEEALLEPHKVGGRGKNARKGTVQSGGIVKKSTATSSVVKEKKDPGPGIMSTTSVEPDDWRPTPEEYKKMSPKEKRQLRNKISARNFRVRRKEYITTLEGDIAERDRLIDHIRTELLGSKSENSALRQEIHALKKALLEGRGLPTTPVLPPPAPLSSVSASAASTSKPTTKSPLMTPNIHKDLPTSPRLGARNFWGGATAANLGGFGGITPVHTTLIPEWGSVLSGKPVAANAERRSPPLQENINPGLNLPLGSQNAQQPGSQLPLNPFDFFADKNMFTLKSMEDYRMQLWTRMGQQQAQHRQMQQQQQVTTPSSSPSPSAPTGLASNMRPHFFAAKQSSTMSALLSGKSVSAYPSSPSSPPMSYQTPLASSSAHNAPSHAEQQAMLAASIASQTLVRKLGGAFWDAFSGGSSSSVGTSGTRPWDADKVRKVLEGKAVVRIVDVEPVPEKVIKRPSSPASSVVDRMASMSLDTDMSSNSSSPALPSTSSDKKACMSKACSILEDGLRNMHL